MLLPLLAVVTVPAGALHREVTRLVESEAQRQQVRCRAASSMRGNASGRHARTSIPASAQWSRAARIAHSQPMPWSPGGIIICGGTGAAQGRRAAFLVTGAFAAPIMP